MVEVSLLGLSGGVIPEFSPFGICGGFPSGGLPLLPLPKPLGLLPRIPPRKILAQIVKIGFPSAFETALYNVAMTLIVRFVNQMDAVGMNVTARSYAMQIANFSYCIGAALAQANAIMTGWRIGSKEFEECDRGTRKAVVYGLITATCFSVTFAMSGHFIVHIFTDDAQMINLVVRLLIVDIFLEFGRVTNLVYGQALKTSGDAVFPVIMGAIFMYLFAVGGTYFLGIHMGLLAVGAYIAMAGDECARAVGMVLRWKSGKWKSKSLVEENMSFRVERQLEDKLEFIVERIKQCQVT